MTGRLQRKPTFLWQAVLILLPLVALAAVGVFSLRQDRILAKRETEARAQSIADDLAGRIWLELTARPDEKQQSPGFQIDGDGHLISPPPYDSVPSPSPLNLDELNPRQRDLWNKMQADVARGSDLTEESAEFLNSNPPDRLATIACYNSGLRFWRQQNFPGAAGMLLGIATNNSRAVGETGLPLRPLALSKLMELAPSLLDRGSVTNFVTPQSLFSDAIQHPTMLTPYLLTMPLSASDGQVEAMQGTFLKVWQLNELSRSLYFMSRSHLLEQGSAAGSFELKSEPITGTNTSSTINMPDKTRLPRFIFLRAGFTAVSDRTQLESAWVGVRNDGYETSNTFVFHMEAELEDYTLNLLSNATHIPSYFGVGVEFGGVQSTKVAGNMRMWSYHHYGDKSGHVEKDYATDLQHQSFELATNVLAHASKIENGIEIVRVGVYLTNPAALYESQSSRALWFGFLIAASAFAAFIGLLTAWTSFNRQIRLNDMKSNFVSSVSHELRAPIASVRLMAESLERGKISGAEKQNEYFRFIGQECRRLSSLIENVLDFSRIEQGRKQYEFEPTDIGALVEQTVKLMEPYAAERGVRLETSNSKLVTRNPELSVDGRAIQQALVNLVDNAIKHSPKEAVVKIEVSGAGCQALSAARTPDLTPNTPHLTLSVTDSGPGIPASEYEKIFERFYRLGSELRRETQGVGIGLSIVKHIVEAHGGCVRVESEPGKGARFTIELPCSIHD